ncbi:hypothetical protein C0995_013594 [Termitomyces sp. Mi166|nr:hypothetical protein C0995_013594 [Termitomyces sp. Mi166\
MIATVFALPSGHVFMRDSCQIGACVAALAPTVVSCVGAAAQEGANLISDAGCLAGAINAGVNMPASCQTCIEDLDLGDKIKAVENGAETVATEVGDEVQDVGDEVGDALGSIF